MIVLCMTVMIVAAVLAALYFLAIMPRLSCQKAGREFQGVYYAHRGLHDNTSDAPENSLAAFRKAVEAGYGIELDIQVTRDKVPVVFHDFTLERICKKPGKVYDYTWQELKSFTLCGSMERIPKLKEVLEVVDGKVPLIVELKVERTDISVCPAADALLQKYNGRYCMESFNPLVLLWYRRHRNDVVRGQLSDGFTRSGEFRGLLYVILQNLLLNWMTRPDFVAYNHKHENVPARRLCRRLYKNMAVAWTIKSQQELEQARDKFDIFIFDSFIPDSK